MPDFPFGYEILKIKYKGYVERTRAVLSAAQKIKRGIQKIDGLHMMGNPIGSVLAFTSDEINVYQLLNDLSKEKKWVLGPIQFPAGIHMSVTHTHTRGGVVEELVKVTNLYRSCKESQIRVYIP